MNRLAEIGLMPPWRSAEIEAVVADYFEMFDLELRGEHYNKAAHNRALQKLTGRSHGSIEMKHQNISAVLRDRGSVYIDGYKPLSNYQDQLNDAVADRLSGDRALARVIAAEADARPVDPPVKGILDREVSPPHARSHERNIVAEARNRRPPAPDTIDYVAREERNGALGNKGELWVIEFERARLIRAGKDALAERVAHVAETEGPSAGFDVRSFERNGTDRLIEVKTTGGPIGMPFFLSPHEVETSRKHEERYHLYRPFRFNRDPHLFIVRGRLDRTCVLEPAVFRAEVA